MVIGIIQLTLNLANGSLTQQILDQSRLKAFADHKFNSAEKLKFVLGKFENIVGKGEKASILSSLKVGIVW